MPNQHYFVIDMTKMGLSNKDEVSDRENPGEKASHTHRLSVQMSLNICIDTEQSSEFSGSDKIRTFEAATLKMTLLPHFYKPLYYPNLRA